ncbi:MAG: hypothetical protein JXA62_06615 [Candidatus Aminicenantes bacterium]|nr:hypothetical protein [Candidatus Aminicenantes bacterium]
MKQNDCEHMRREMVLWLSGESDGIGVVQHVEACRGCARYLDQLQRLMGQIDIREREIGSSLQGMDWEGLAKQVTRHAMQPQAASDLKRRRLPLAAALFGLGLLTGYLVFSHRAGIPAGSNAARQLSDSIRLVETVKDQREIIDFLGRARLLLLEILHAQQSEQERDVLAGAAAGLLREYRYLGHNLTQSRIQEARGVMERLSWVLTELSYDPPPGRERVAAVRRMVERERLLFKVRLIERELESPVREV